MGIPAPRFDYNSLATPGGIGQGLGALSGALVDASARRKQAEVAQAKLDFEKQGLARLQANDQINRSQGLMRFQEDVNRNRAHEQYQMGELDRQKEADDNRREEKAYQEQRQMPLDAAALELTKARTGQANRAQPSAVRDRTIVTPQVYLESTKAAEARADARIAREQADPAYRKAKADSQGSITNWHPTAAPADPATKREAYVAEEMGKLGMPLKAPAWGQGGQGGGSDLRARATKAWNGQLPPEFEQALKEAEAGDADSAASIEKALAGHPDAEAETPAEEVAPEEETDLLGNPVRR